MHELVRRCKRAARQGAGLDRRQPERPAPLGRQGLQGARRPAVQPAVAGMLTVAPAMIKKQTRGLYPAPEAILAAWSKARRWTSIPRCASRVALPGQAHDRGQVREDHDQHLLLQPECHQERPQPRPAMRPRSSRQGRLAGRRHDGRRHRLRAGHARHRHGAERREPDKAADRARRYSAKLTQKRVDKGR